MVVVRTSFFDSVMMLVLAFGLVGTFVGGFVGQLVGFREDGAVLGAFAGAALAGFVGILWWTSPRRHRHDWKGGLVYDKEMKPQFMLKFCLCGEIMFDGFFGATYVCSACNLSWGIDRHSYPVCCPRCGSANISEYEG